MYISMVCFCNFFVSRVGFWYTFFVFSRLLYDVGVYLLFGVVFVMFVLRL